MANTYSNGIGLLFKIDADQLLPTPSGTPDFQSLNVTGVDIALNEGVDTFYPLAEEGFSINKVVSLDPQFDLTIKYKSDDTVGNDLYGKRFETDRCFPFEITDPVTGETVSFDGEVTTISDARSIEEVIEFAFTVKMVGKPTIA